MSLKNSHCVSARKDTTCYGAIKKSMKIHSRRVSRRYWKKVVVE